MSEDFTMVDKIIPSDDVVYKVKDNISDSAHINKSQYEQMYLESINNKEDFWAKQAQTIDWIDRFTSVKKTSFTGEININWFEGGELNVSVNCIDRHLATRANQTAIIWEGDNPQESKKISYLQLYYEVCKLANVLRDMGVVKGDFEELLEWERGIGEEYKQYGNLYKEGRLKFLESIMDNYPTNSGNILKLIDWVKKNY